MPLRWWDCLMCLMPSLLLWALVALVVVSRPVLGAWTGRALTAVGWTLWRGLCVLLHLPLQKTPPQTSSSGTELLFKPSSLAQHLLRHCGALSRTRLAPWPRGDPHLQTVQSLCGLSTPALQKRITYECGLQFSRDHLLLRDGAIVALDWVVGECEGGRRSSPPVLLLVPEHWGSLTPHLCSLCHSASALGFYVVLFHHRGTAGCPLTTTRLTEFGDPADLDQAVAYIHSRHPSSVLLAVSEGSGSGTLLSYLGEKGSGSRITAAAAISPVLLGQLWFETAMPPLYHWGVLFHRKQQLRRYASSFSRVLDVAHVLRSSSLKEFEERLFCQHQSEAPWGLTASASWGLQERARPAPDWDAYWERNEPLRDADEVEVPVLCLLSRDDPLLPPAGALPLNLFQSNPFFIMVLTDTGGHCGFSTANTRDGRTENWSHTAVLEYFRAAVDFLKGGGEGRSVGFTISPMGEQRQRTNTFRRRRAAGMRRSLNQTVCQTVTEDDEFTWKRAYTR
ncbi:unnamed protein product [Knipowitschia caucasica]|uniref:Uncharacterized protein n=1 Tax=Knipowitschia caucasica TaxID=637954 RepID=A0AAV2J8C4_KNICA